MDTALDFGQQVVFAAEVGTSIALKTMESAGVDIYVPTEEQVNELRNLAQPEIIGRWLEIAGPYGPDILAVAQEYSPCAVK